MAKTYTKLHSRGLASALPSVNIEDGKIRLATDTGQLYFDVGNRRIEISDFVMGLTEDDILATLAPLPKIYLAKDTLNMFYYTDNGWENILRKYYSCTITGDGAASEFTIVHNLNTLHIKLSMTDVNSHNCFIDYNIIDAQSVKLQFAEIPAATDTYHVVISIL